LQSLTLTPSKPRKKINVLEAYTASRPKPQTNFVVIGHVDAGKSTLMGRLLYELGAVEERTIQKFKSEAERIGKSSFHFAWVLDQTAEERSRYYPLPQGKVPWLIPG
jgi:elongation factor 1 alpha-like protein